jgi:hypothetical protein
MDAANLKKLQEYAAFIAKKAEQEEAEGKGSEAAKDYIKLVDILLILGREAKDHPTWLRYTKSAEFYQNRVRSIVSAGKSNAGNAGQATPPPPVAQTVATQGAPGEAPPPHSQPDRTANQPSPAKVSPIKRFFGFQKNETKPSESQSGSEQKNPDQEKSEIASSATTTSLAGVAEMPPTANSGGPKKDETREETKSPAPKEADVPKIEEEEKTVPYSVYERLVSENKLLQEKIDSLKNRAGTLEKENRDLAEKLGSMVSRAEYEEMKQRLSDSVPKDQLSDLQKIYAESTVPRELYVEAEKRAARLEAKLENSLPASVFDKLASDISLMIATAEIPLNDAAPKEKENPDGDSKVN